MACSWRQILIVTLVIVPSVSNGDEAVTHQGRRITGILRKQDFLVAGSETTLRFEALQRVQFPAHPAPLTRCRLQQQLLLAGTQRLVGALRSVSANEIEFQLPSGKALKVPRKQVHGIVHADGLSIQLAEDFEGAMKSLTWIGKPQFSKEHVFSGEQSLWLKATAPDSGLVIPTAQLSGRPWRATLHFFVEAAQSSATANIQFIFQTQTSRAAVTLLLDTRHYRLNAATACRLEASAGWHIVQVDWHDGEARVFIDDYFLGSQVIGRDARLASVRFSFAGDGGMWLDAFCLAERMPPLARTPGPPELDEIQLASGEQIFGSVVGATERDVVLDARFGKRSYAWSQIRGIFFGAQVEPEASDHNVEVRFRSGPGVSPDQLTGAIVDLDERRLLLRHPVLGELAIARTRLEGIRFPNPAPR